MKNKEKKIFVLEAMSFDMVRRTTLSIGGLSVLMMPLLILSAVINVSVADLVTLGYMSFVTLISYSGYKFATRRVNIILCTCAELYYTPETGEVHGDADIPFWINLGCGLFSASDFKVAMKQARQTKQTAG